MRESCLIIAGEKSGEEHCLSFFDKLKEGRPNTDFWGVGGDELKAKGVEIIYHLKDFSSWGVSEVVSKIPFYYKALNHIIDQVESRNTKVAILIDFQDFNLRLAKKLSAKGVQVLYYVAPQAWAWKSGRAKVLQETVNTLFTIIPFEKKWFLDRGVSKVLGVEHPLYRKYKTEIMPEKLGIQAKPFSKLKESINILLLPGSRNFEVKGLLPKFMDAIKLLNSDFKINIAIVPSPSVNRNLYESYNIDKYFSHEDLVNAFEWADFCFAASGTVTLATALFELPTIVCYKTSLLNEFIFYTFLSYNGYISLANIIHEDEVFPELIQDRVSGYNIQQTLKKWIDSEESYKSIKLTLENTSHLLKGEVSSVENNMIEVLRTSYDNE